MQAILHLIETEPANEFGCATRKITGDKAVSGLLAHMINALLPAQHAVKPETWDGESFAGGLKIYDGSRLVSDDLPPTDFFHGQPIHPTATLRGRYSLRLQPDQTGRERLVVIFAVHESSVHMAYLSSDVGRALVIEAEHLRDGARVTGRWIVGSGDPQVHEIRGKLQLAELGVQ